MADLGLEPALIVGGIGALWFGADRLVHGFEDSVASPTGGAARLTS